MPYDCCKLYEVVIGPAGSMVMHGHGLGPGQVLNAKVCQLPIMYLKYALPAGPISMIVVSFNS